MIVSIVFLTSIVQSGLPFEVFPQALTINGFTGAVMGATFGPAIIGEWLRHSIANNASTLGFNMLHTNFDAIHMPLTELCGIVQRQALAVSMKEIYGWLLIICIVSLALVPSIQILFLTKESLMSNNILHKFVKKKTN